MVSLHGTPVATYARIRPALTREIGAGEAKTLDRCVAQRPGSNVIHVNTKAGAPVVVEEDGSSLSDNVRTFELDGVFDETCETCTVYEAAALPLVDRVVGGMNATILCYGMTGSGKTHTMLGEEGRGEGIVGLAASQIFAAVDAARGAISVECGFMQLYGTVATDLLVQESGVSLKIARRENDVVVEGQRRCAVRNAADVAALVAEGVSRRKVASQRLNSASSRSHAVLTFFLWHWGDPIERDDNEDSDVDTVVARCSKLVCVDLAGSERVKESGVSGTALKEAQAINLSLFHLTRVVQVLNQSAVGVRRAPQVPQPRVPYADSPLTLLLSDALGGSSLAAIISTLSPAQEHASQTSGSCGFAAACRGVRNDATRVAAKRVPRYRPWMGADASEEAERRKKREAKAEGDAAALLPWAGVAPGDTFHCPGGRQRVEVVGLGSISCLIYGQEEGAATQKRGLALVLHGNPSDARDMNWLAPPLLHAGYLVVCPDMPGFGESPAPPSGGRMGTRSENACDPNGPAEVVEGLMRALGHRTCTIIGYDWGAGVALAMAASAMSRRFVSKVVCMHPAFAKEKVTDELKNTQADTLIMWAEDNSFHSWSRFKPLAAKLKQRLANRYTEYRTKRESDTAWSRSARSRAIVKFLTGIDPLPQAQTVIARPHRADVAADGTAIQRSDGIIFRANVSEDMVRAADTSATACAEIVRVERAGELGNLIRHLARAGAGEEASAIRRFARHLPIFDDATLTPARLEDLGLWSGAARSAADALMSRVARTPRYFVGRQVLVPGGHQEIGELKMFDPSSDRALVVTNGGRERAVSWESLLRLNQRHLLPSTVGSDGCKVMRLEDGLWANFGSPLLRVLMARAALAIDSIFANDVAAALEAGDEGALDEARALAVRAIRSCLDVTSFARAGGAERGRERTRYAKDDIAKMAAYGEGHCRTCSSCFAPFLWSFAELLAIDPHYCTDSYGRHQWLQYEARPSMRAYCCDIYRDENEAQRGAPRGASLGRPVEATYTAPSSDGGERDEVWLLFPADEPLALGGREVHSAPLELTDVAL